MKTLSLWELFKRSWTPKLITHILSTEKHQSIWKFWFCINIAIAFLMTAVIGVFVIEASKNFSLQEIAQSLEIQDFRIYIDESGIETHGIPDPFTTNLTQGSTSQTNEDFVFHLDTNKTTDINILNNYEGGILIGKNEIVIKESEYTTHVIPTEKFLKATGNKNILITPEVIEHHVRAFLRIAKWYILCAFFIFLYIWYALIRLLFALFWASLLWIIGGKIMQIPLLSFSKAYMMILSIYHIPVLIQIVLMINGIFLPGVTLFLFTLICGMNLYDLQRKK